MLRRLVAVVALSLLAVGCGDGSRRSAVGLLGFTEERLLVGVPPKDQPEALASILDITASYAQASGSENPPRVEDLPELAKLGYLVVTTGDLYPDGVANAVITRPKVRGVTRDQRRSLVGPLGADPGIGGQWAHDKLGTRVAWGRGFTGRGVLVAVVDTGVQCDHPDLLCASSKDFTGSGSANDENGHGTHVAGIVAARGDNGVGGVGIAPDASILAVRVLDAEGSGWDSWISAGIVWATDNGAKVINLSLGGADGNEVLHRAVEYAYKRGVLLACAAGNDGEKEPTYPNAYPECVGVAATKKDGEVGTSWTNYGVNADVGAPGDSIMSTCIRSRQCSMSGTSMAAPMIAGVFAIELSGGIKWNEALKTINLTGVPLTGRLTGLKRPDVAALSALLVNGPRATASSTRRPVATSTSTRRPTATPRPTRTSRPISLENGTRIFLSLSMKPQR